MYPFCLLFSYLIKVVALLIFICFYQLVLVNKYVDFRKSRTYGESMITPDCIIERCMSTTDRMAAVLTSLSFVKDVLNTGYSCVDIVASFPSYRGPKL